MNDLLHIAYKAMEEKLADDIIVIDFQNQSPFLDYFIIASVRNKRMANSIIDNVQDKINEAGYDCKKIYNNDDSGWYLIDLDSVICHVFFNEQREVYNLEGLWKDLPTIKM